MEVGQGLSDWGLDKALIQRANVTDREYNAAWTFDLLRCLTLAAVIALAAPSIAIGFGEPRATNLIRVLAFTPLLAATTSAKRQDLQRRLDFKALTVIRLPEGLVEAVVAISLAPRIGVWALAVAAVVSICWTSRCRTSWRLIDRIAPGFDCDRRAVAIRSGGRSGPLWQ